MKAVVCTRLGGPADLELREVDTPVPGPGQIRVKVTAAGVNFPDNLIISGKYQERPELPFVPGMELAGVVDAVGVDADDPTVAGFDVVEKGSLGPRSLFDEPAFVDHRHEATAGLDLVHVREHPLLDLNDIDNLR